MDQFPRWFFIALFSFFLGAASVFAYQKWQPAKPTGSVLVASSSTPHPVVSLQPSADPTIGWQTFTGKEIAFKYPLDWTVKEEYSDYFSGYMLTLENANKIVSIVVTPSQEPYGFAGPDTLSENQLLVTVGGKSYSVDETTVENRAVFVDFPVNFGKKQYFILFGSGYPVNDDQKASINDYNKEKSNILQILSTFQFLNYN